MWFKLRQICFHTTDRFLRDYLAENLIEDNHLSEEDIEIVNYVKVLEQLYSCKSYEIAKSLKIEEDQGKDERFI